MIFRGLAVFMNSGHHIMKNATLYVSNFLFISHNVLNGKKFWFARMLIDMEFGCNIGNIYIYIYSYLFLEKELDTT